MCLLDKHAAHERIIYESLAASYGKVSSQMLLVPVTVQLSAEEKDALVQSEMLLQDSGLEVEDFGGNSVVVRAVPADVVPEDVEDLVVELASRLVSTRGIPPAKKQNGCCTPSRAARPSRREIKRTLHSCCAWRRMCWTAECLRSVPTDGPSC